MTSSSQALPTVTTAPRFDLRFRAGKGHLVLGRPVPVMGARLEELTLEVVVPSRFDLGDGRSRLRRMRSSVERARAEIRWRGVVQWAQDRGAELQLRGLRSQRLAVALRDATGVLAAELDVHADGADLVGGLRSLEWVRPGVHPPFTRLRSALAPLGIRWEAHNGVFRLPRPLRSLLAEVLLPSGYRLPEERSCGLTLTLKRRSLILDAEGQPEPADLDRYRRQIADPPPWLREAMGVAERGRRPEATTGSGGGKPADANKDRPAERSADASSTSATQGHASAWLRGDATRFALEERLQESRSPLRAAETDALLDALWLHREDVALWREWIDRLGVRKDPAVIRLARAVGELPMSDRDVLLVQALRVASEAGVPASSIAQLLDRAERSAPTSPHLWALRAALYDADDARAAELWARAADAVGDEEPELASRWRLAAAEHLRALRGPLAALPLASRASREAPQDPRALTLWFELLDQLNRHDELDEVFARLLSIRPADDESEDLWERGLARAAAFYTGRADPDRARPFLVAMEAHRPSAAPEALSDPPKSWTDDSEPPLRDPDYEENDHEDDDLDGEGMASGEISRQVRVDPTTGDEDFDTDWPASEVWSAEDWGQQPRFRRHGDGDEEWSPPEVWDAEPRLADSAEEPGEDDESDEGPQSGTHEAPRIEESEVTRIGVADEEMRELLAEARDSEDPGAYLEGALEGAIDDEDDDAMERVLAVLDRLGTFVGRDTLRRRALRWLARHDDDAPAE